MQRIGVVAASRNGFIAEPVAALAGNSVEGAIDDSFPAGVPRHAWKRPDHRFKPVLCGINGFLHLLHLVLIFREAKFGEHFRQTVVQVSGVGVEASLLAHLVHHLLHVGVDLRHDSQLHVPCVLRQRVTQSVDVSALDSGDRFHLFEGGAGANPELAVAGICVKLFRGAGGARFEVQNGLMRFLALCTLLRWQRVQNQDRVRLHLSAQPRQVCKS